VARVQADNLLRFQDEHFRTRGHSQHAGRKLAHFSVFLQAKEEVWRGLPALWWENKEKTGIKFPKRSLTFDRSFNGLRWDSGTSEIRINSFYSLRAVGFWK
jgi:hypothetical protein